VLPQLQNIGFEWLVPALRAELVTALVRSLPKDLRKRLVPVPEVTAKVLERMTPRSGPLLTVLAAEIEAQRGVRIPPDAWDLSRLPSYLKMTFSVEDEHGKVIAAGQDLDALREKVRPTLRKALAAATRRLERTGQTSWTFGTIPKAVALPGTGQTVRAYPSLVDEGESVGLRALESPGAQALNMRVGTRRLLALTIPSPLRSYERGSLGSAAQLVLMEAPHANPRAVLEDAATAAISSLMTQAGGPVWDEASFNRLRDFVAGHAADETARIVAQTVKILQAARTVRAKLDTLRGAAFDEVRRDVAQQLGRLVFAGFITPTGAGRLADVERYLRGAEWRLERLHKAAAVDRDRMRAVQELENLYRRKLEDLPAGRGADGELSEVPWLLEELRMSQFAQAIGAKGQVSSRKIRRILDEAR
jgi:ATP-dependent helicase HrpA